MRSEAFVEDPLLSKDVDLENEEWLSTTTSDERRQSPLRAKFSQCNATCIFLVAIIVSMLIYFGFVFDKRQTDQECAAQLSIWCTSYKATSSVMSRTNTPVAPVLEAVEYVSYDFSNAFDGKSPFRGPPTAELEARWENLTFSRYLLLRWYGVIANHESLEHAVTIPPERFKDLNRWDDTHYRPNPDGYGALVEVFHQLHCLVSDLLGFLLFFQS